MSDLNLHVLYDRPTHRVRLDIGHGSSVTMSAEVAQALANGLLDAADRTKDDSEIWTLSWKLESNDRS